MKTKLIILSILALCLSTAPAMAATFGDGGASLQGVLDDITTSSSDPWDGTPGNSSVNVTTENLSDSLDSLWMLTDVQGAATMIIELAGFAADNEFGIYESGDVSNKVTVFDGSHVAGDIATVKFLSDGKLRVNVTDPDDNLLNTYTSADPFAGNAFGFYLDSTDNAAVGGGLFYSDTSLNTADGLDHMYAYQGEGDMVLLPEQMFSKQWTPGGFVLAWEDLVGPYGDPYGGTTGKSDRDFTDMVLMIESINPVPVPGAVLLGILGLSAAGIKLRRFA